MKPYCGTNSGTVTDGPRIMRVPAHWGLELRSNEGGKAAMIETFIMGWFAWLVVGWVAWLVLACVPWLIAMWRFWGAER